MKSCTATSVDAKAAATVVGEAADKPLEEEEEEETNMVHGVNERKSNAERRSIVRLGIGGRWRGAKRLWIYGNEDIFNPTNITVSIFLESHEVWRGHNDE